VDVPDARIRQVVHFHKPGPQNTQACLDIVAGLVQEGLRDVVVATTWGDTGLAFAERFKGSGTNLVCVTHSAGFKNPGEQECTPERIERMRSLGAKVYSGTILTHSIEANFAQEFGGTYPTIIIAQTLRRLCQGIKVAVEIVMEACDAGLIPEGIEVVAVGGTGRGADTVAIIRSAASKRFLKLQVLEIRAMPRS
jgi:hypothetical protein